MARFQVKPGQYLCLACGMIGPPGFTITKYRGFGQPPNMTSAKRTFIGCNSGCTDEFGNEIEAISYDEAQEGFPSLSKNDAKKAQQLLFLGEIQ